MTMIWAGPAVGWAYLVRVIDCSTQEIVGWNLSHRGPGRVATNQPGRWRSSGAEAMPRRRSSSW